MVYLIVSILFMAALAVCFGAGAQRNVGALGLNAVFRLTGGVLGVVAILAFGDLSELPRLWAGVGWLSLVGGFFYWLAGMAGIQAVRHGHLGVSWTVTRCAVVIPSLVSIIYWREIPLWPVSPVLVLRLSGLVLTVLAVTLVGVDRIRRRSDDLSQPPSRAWIAWMALSFVSQGTWEALLRASGSMADDASRGFFMVTVFVVSAILAVGVWGIQRPRIGRSEITFGVLAGVCGFIGSGLRPWALRELDGIIVFPITAICVMLLVQFAGAFLWGHHIATWGRVALAVAIGAIICLTV